MYPLHDRRVGGCSRRGVCKGFSTSIHGGGHGGRRQARTSSLSVRHRSSREPTAATTQNVSQTNSPPIRNEASESRPAKVPGNQTGRRTSRLRDEASRNEAIARILQSADTTISRCNFGAKSTLNAMNTSISSSSETPRDPAILPSRTHTNTSVLNRFTPSDPSICTSTTPSNPPRTARPQPPPPTVEDDSELYSDSPSSSTEPLPTSPALRPHTGSPQPPDSPAHPAVQDTPSGRVQINQTPWEPTGASREVRLRSTRHQRKTNQLRYSKSFGVTTVPNLLTCDHQIKRHGRNQRSHCTVCRFEDRKDGVKVKRSDGRRRECRSTNLFCDVCNIWFCRACVDRIVAVNASVTADMEAGKLRPGRKPLASGKRWI
ncbi:hypothetical protein FPQ18DRAFT_315968, partial [Pyronema domesticum]